MHQIHMPLVLRPIQRWMSLQRSPRTSIAAFKGPTSKGKIWNGREGKRKEKKGKGKGEELEGKREGPLKSVK